MRTSIAFVAALLAPAVSARALRQRAPAASTDVVAIGAHVIYSYDSAAVPSTLHTLVDQGKVGGVILFGQNVNSGTAAAMQDLQDTWSQSASYNGAPLLIVTDEEGGEVARLPGGPTLSEKEVGASSNPTAAARTAGTQAAKVLLQYKNNGNLAPVCGVFRQPGDFLDQYERSYSNESAIAAECVGAFITAQQAAGALSAAKHFPGLGAATTDEDTDARPVTLNQSLSELRSVDLPPFQAAVKAGVKMMMPSWAYYPALDPHFPSGLSSKWIQGELRGTLGFKGVTISDAIEAGGLDAFGKDDGYRATLASAAGMDLILAAALNPTQGSGIVDTLSKALKNGTLNGDAFGEATARILSLRKGIKT